MTAEMTNERCPRCGSVLLHDKSRDRYWCSFVGDRQTKGCGFGLDKPINSLALGIIKARGHEADRGQLPPTKPIKFSKEQE